MSIEELIILYNLLRERNEALEEGIELLERKIEIYQRKIKLYKNQLKQNSDSMVYYEKQIKTLSNN